MNNLPELRDIHLPDGVSAFPPAIGWWIIVLVLVGLYVSYELGKIIRQKSKKLYALRLLSSARGINMVNEVRKMSEILRRICVFKYPEATVLIGQDWIGFLNEHCQQKLPQKSAELLIDAPYMPVSSTAFSQEDAEKLRQFCQEWIGENL